MSANRPVISGQTVVKRRKILIVSRCAWTLVTFRRGLIKYLLNRDTEVHVAGWGGDGYADVLTDMGVVFHDIPVSLSPLSPFSDLRLTWILARLYRTVEPDIVHHFTVKPVIYGSVAARISATKSVLNTVTGLGYAFTDASRLLSAVVRIMYRTALSKSRTVFFQNSDDRELFVKLKIVREGITEIVPGSGVDLDHFHPKHREVNRGGKVKVLFVGRLLVDKGVLEFIRAAKTLRKGEIDIHFQVLGDFDERNPSCISREVLENAVNAGIIDWLGKTDDVRSFLSKADIVVLPSYREGVPRSLLEAAAMAIPLVASDVPGCRRIVEHNHNGLLVAPRDADALAAALNMLASNSQLRETMGRAGRQKAASEFDENLVFQQTWRAYERCFD